jgi:hypothetical protein
LKISLVRTLAVGLLLTLPLAIAQKKPAPHLNIKEVAALPDDVKSPEAIVHADYECISGGVGVARQWARDLSLYGPNARSFSPSRNAKTGKLSVWSPTEQEYADAVDASFVKEGFTEREVAHKTYRYGNVATVVSSYEGTLASTGKLYARGVNIYTVYFAEDRWWISSVSWDDENPINPIPAELAAIHLKS